MRDHGYPKEFAVGVTAASATLGPIIPPSLPFVIYGVVANVSIGQLFAAGFIPGAVMALLMMVDGRPTTRTKNNWGARHQVLVAADGQARSSSLPSSSRSRRGSVLSVVAARACRAGSRSASLLVALLAAD